MHKEDSIVHELWGGKGQQGRVEWGRSAGGGGGNNPIIGLPRPLINIHLNLLHTKEGNTHRHGLTSFFFILSHIHTQLSSNKCTPD